MHVQLCIFLRIFFKKYNAFFTRNITWQLGAFIGVHSTALYILVDSWLDREADYFAALSAKKNYTQNCILCLYVCTELAAPACTPSCKAIWEGCEEELNYSPFYLREKSIILNIIRVCVSVDGDWIAGHHQREVVRHAANKPEAAKNTISHRKIEGSSKQIILYTASSPSSTGSLNSATSSSSPGPFLLLLRLTATLCQCFLRDLLLKQCSHHSISPPKMWDK